MDDDWWRHALCRGMDPDWWYPEQGGDMRRPKAICAGCPVRVPCGEYAIAHHEKFGVWGGLSERERKRIRALRSKAA